MSAKTSLNMIVKNESATLGRCLSSVRDLVDEMILLDTGSSDGTLDIDRQHGARVFEMPWPDSFAVARNESIRHASEQWLLWLDADEHLDEANREKLRHLLAGLGDDNTAYVLKCVRASAGQRTSVTDARGFTSAYAYDAMNRLAGETLADTSTTNSVYTYTYDKVGNKLTTTDPLNHTTTSTYDAMNRLRTSIDALLETTTYTYDGNGNLVGLTNPLNQTTTSGYDAANRLTMIINALNETTTLGYDAAGELTSETDPLNHTTTYGYSVLGKLTSITDPLGDVINYSYNSAGDQTAMTVTGPGTQSGSTTYDYNAGHEQTASIDALQQQTSYVYDADGNLISATDPLNHTTTYGCNAINQLTSVTDPLNHITTYGYDADGNRTSVTDPLNRTTTSNYDAQGRLLSVTDPLNGTTSYVYDLAGNEISITDPDNNTTSYTYDAVNQLTKMTDPLGHSATYAYDAAGELTSYTDRDGRTITYGFDAVGHLTSETWVNGNYTAAYAYNAGGLLTSASDPFSSYTYAYDAANRLTSVDNNGTPGVPHIQLDYSYNAWGNRTQLTDNLNNSITYTWDTDQRLTQVQINAASSTYAQVSLSYDAASRLTNITRTINGGDTIQSTLSYDNANNLTNLTHTDSTAQVTLANYTYGYDAANQLTSYQDSNSSVTYGYDKNGELTSASGTLNGSNYGVAYSYDASGNRTMTGYKTGTGNELTSDGTYNYAYDNEGNMTSQTNISTGYVTYYSWDYRNRLTEVKAEDNHGNILNDEKFTYDVNNNRIGVSLNGTQQLYTVYDGHNPYMDFNGSGALMERYLTDPHGLNDFYAQLSGSGTPQWLLTDNINSIRLLVSTTGSVLDGVTYDPFGNVVSQTNSANAPRFLYTGAAYDALTGTYLDGAREEDPANGRWLSQDPLGLKPDSNPYRYVGNDPIGATDPNGLETSSQEQNQSQSPGGNLGYGTYFNIWDEMMAQQSYWQQIERDHIQRQLDAMKGLYTDWNQSLQERMRWYERGIQQDRAHNRTPPSREQIDRMQKQMKYNQKMLEAINWYMKASNYYTVMEMELQRRAKVTLSLDRLKETYKAQYQQLLLQYQGWYKSGRGSPTYMPPSGQPSWWNNPPEPIDPRRYNPIWWESEYQG